MNQRHEMIDSAPAEAKVLAQQDPFARDPLTCIRVRVQQEALERMKWVIEQGMFGIFTGEVGSGKTTLIRTILQELDPLRYEPVYLSISEMKPAEFYGEMLRRFGEPTPFGLTRAKRAWEDWLKRREIQEQRKLVVVIDEGQEMTAAMLLELRFVMAQQMDSQSAFPLLLIGQPELRHLMRLNKFEAIAQRAAIQYHLGAMSQEDTAHYIRTQMNPANRPADWPRFAEGAIQLIHSASKGIPRMINKFGMIALKEAQSKQTDVIDEILMTRVIKDLEKQRGAAG